MKINSFRLPYPYYFLLILICLLPVATSAQTNDCKGAIVVCTNDNINLNPIGPGNDDYANSQNDPGCIVDLENNSSWFYFEINANAPSGLTLGFVIHPNGGLGEDYDWALYGPDVQCNNLGTPVRCSSSSSACDFCPETGMGNNTTDISEGPGSGDGFVMTLQVKAGEGFFLLIDNWQGTQNGFELTWTGSAAEYLDCDVEVPCGITAFAGPDIIACGGFQQNIPLHGSSQHTQGNEKYTWTGTNGGTGYLSNPNIANPDIQLPVNFTGIIVYTLTVVEDSCINKDVVVVTVSHPDVNILPAGPFCESALPQLLTASPAGGSWSGVVNSNIFDPGTLGPGTHTVIYHAEDINHCADADTIDIEVFKDSGITIGLGQDISIPLGHTIMTEANSNFSPEQIDTIIWSPADIITCLDPKCIHVILHPVNDALLTATIFDVSGCTGTDDMYITVTKDRRVYIPTVFSPNQDGINDAFYISPDLSQITLVKKLEIYNRWGALVHQAANFLPGQLGSEWNGLDKTGRINPGVYVYLAEIEFIDGAVIQYKGDVTILP